MLLWHKLDFIEFFKISHRFPKYFYWCCIICFSKANKYKMWPTYDFQSRNLLLLLSLFPVYFFRTFPNILATVSITTSPPIAAAHFKYWWHLFCCWVAFQYRALSILDRYLQLLITYYFLKLLWLSLLPIWISLCFRIYDISDFCSVTSNLPMLLWYNFFFLKNLTF